MSCCFITLPFQEELSFFKDMLGKKFGILGFQEKIDVIFKEACSDNVFVANCLLKQKPTTVVGAVVVGWTNILRKAYNFPQPDICVLTWKNKKQQHSVMLTACMWPFFFVVKSGIRFRPNPKMFAKIKWKPIKLFSCVSKRTFNRIRFSAFVVSAVGLLQVTQLINFSFIMYHGAHQRYHPLLIRMIISMTWASWSWLCNLSGSIKSPWLFKKLIKTMLFSVRLAWSWLSFSIQSCQFAHIGCETRTFDWLQTTSVFSL